MQVVVCRAHVTVAAEDYFLVMAAAVLLAVPAETQEQLATVEMAELVSLERQEHRESQGLLVALAVPAEMQLLEKQVMAVLVVLAVLDIPAQ
jgi:hypothetical protein